MLRNTKIAVKMTAGFLLIFAIILGLTGRAHGTGIGYNWLSGPSAGSRTSAQLDFNSNSPSTSSDGKYVAYISRKSDLVPGVADGLPHAYLYDESSAHVEILSVDSNNNLLPGFISGGLLISANGRYIAFQQRVTTSGVTTFPIYVRDNTNKTTVIASMTSQGQPIGSGDGLLGISNNGVMLFSYTNSQSIVDTPYSNSSLYLRDIVNQTTRQVPELSGFPGWSITETGAQISADGMTLLVTLKDNLHQGSGLHIGLIKTDSWTAENISGSIDGAIQSSNVNQPLVKTISQNGRFSVIQVFDFWVWDDQAKTITQQSSINNISSSYSISEDGRYIGAKTVDTTNTTSTVKYNLSLIDRANHTIQIIVPSSDVDPDGNVAGYTFAPGTGQFAFNTAQGLDSNDTVSGTYDLYESKDTPLRIDTTPPVIVASILPHPNDDDWNNANVTVSFTCTDDSSGIASCSGPTTLTTAGANQTVTGTATDNAGNSTQATATVSIDKTVPTISYVVTPVPNSDGWNKGGVIVTFNCNDVLSGIKSCTDPITLNTDGANQIVTGTAVDKAGNVSSVTAAINIDKVAPAISYSIDSTPNSSDWSNGNVTVTFNCSDALSGIKSCTDPITLNTDGANQIANGTAIDKAGNISSVTATVNIDKTAPTISYSVAPTPNSNGWNNGNVTVTFNCSDALSGIASCSDPVTLSTEGYFQIVTGTATDNAGNISTVTAIVNVDKSAPAISYTVTPTPNSHGWNNRSVIVSFNCSDNLSGVANCSDPVTLNTDGSNQTATGTATDNAGNTSSITATVNIDKTAPTISYSVAPTPNSNGWNNGNVTVTFNCGDALSGVASCTDPITLNTEGSNQTITGTATDNAGNSSSVTTTVNIDKTAPTIDYSLSSGTNSNGWNNGNVTVAFTCSDGGSGIDTCPGPVTLTEGAGQIITGIAIDKAGNSASVSVMLNIDKTAPTINYTVSPTPNSSGWNNGNVTVTFNCSDALSGIQSCSNPVSLTTNGANQTATGTATDNAGNTSSVTATVSIDKTAPSINYSVTPAANSNGWNNGNVTVSFICSDSGSGISVCPGPATLTNEGGGQIITGTATDNAGNSASVSAMVNIDKTIPTVSNLSWSANPLQQGQLTTLSVAATDSLSGAASVQYSIEGGTPQSMSYDSASNTWKASFGSNLAVNTYNITVTATDQAGNSSSGASDVLAIYTTGNGYVTGHSKTVPTASDILPIGLDSGGGTKLVIGFTNATAPASGSFDINYKVDNNQNEFSLSSTGINWVVVQDSTHASILGHGDMTTYVNGVKTVTQNVAVRFDITLGTNGNPDQISVKIFNSGIDPNSGIPAYTINDVVIPNGSNLMIHL